MLPPSYKRWPQKTDPNLRIRSATPRRSRMEVCAAIAPRGIRFADLPAYSWFRHCMSLHHLSDVYRY